MYQGVQANNLRLDHEPECSLSLPGGLPLVETDRLSLGFFSGPNAVWESLPQREWNPILSSLAAIPALSVQNREYPANTR